MKKIIFSAFIAASIFACQPKSETTTSTNNFPADADGYTLAASENIELAKKSAKCIETGDTAAYRATYSADAVIHENAADETVSQNMAAIQAVRDAGVKITIDSGAIYHEVVYATPKGGHTNYVFAYMVMTMAKGGKQLKINMHAVDAIKDGKQVEEWLFYDTKGFAELLK
jgi:ketosteroid isomerase-like protein